MANLNRILYQDSCFLRWDIPGNNYEAQFQILNNNIWNNITEQIGSDLEANIGYYYPKENAKYRILYTSNYCADTLSNVVEVSCKLKSNLIVNCSDTLIDLQYDSVDYSFQLFFGLDFQDTMIGETFWFDTIQGNFNPDNAIEM